MKNSLTSIWKLPFGLPEPGHHRFSHRPKRITRRAERDLFTLLVVPVIWILVVVGMAGVLVGALHYLVTDETNLSFYLFAAVPLLSALMLALFPLIRGHHNRALDEP